MEDDYHWLRTASHAPPSPLVASFGFSLATMSDHPDISAAPAAPPVNSRRAARWILAVTGIACVGLGAVGAVVPGLPTTIFLMIAVWCFARSCPYLERVLIRNRFFAPFLRYLDRTEPLPTRAKATAILTMWVFVSFAIVLFIQNGGPPNWLAAPVAGAACIGTVAIVRWDVGLRRTTESP